MPGSTAGPGGVSGVRSAQIEAPLRSPESSTTVGEAARRRKMRASLVEKRIGPERRSLPHTERTEMDVERLTELLREAEEHHGEYEPTAPPHHWSTWYAAYIVARDGGASAEDAVAAATAHTEGGATTE